MSFAEKILDYKDEILSDLKKLLEIKSVSSENPEECKNALRFIIKRARDFGLITENIDDKACHIELGNSGKLCGVLTHLDVVPAGKNWSVEPFTLTRKNGRLYGRGIDDDKGASIINLYCLKALKDSKISGRNTVRCIFGTDEEIGMSDMDAYFSRMPLPDYSFTPDSDYGICFAEKGILQLKIISKENDGDIKEFTSGGAVNAVADEAKVVYNSDNELKSESAYGKAAHACEPYKGDNAAIKLIMLLKNNINLGSLIRFAADKLSQGTDGGTLGIKVSDKPSGALTCNPGKFRINEKENYLTLDIRYPVTENGESILARVKSEAEKYGLKTEIIHHAEPLYLPKESAVIKLLSSAYEEVTGEKPELYSTGGGTYARKLGGKGVAFGPAFKSDNVNMHNADESIDEENFFTHAEICMQAIYKMYTEELI